MSKEYYLNINKEIWDNLSLNESVFINKDLNINSNDIRSCHNRKELRAISSFLQGHLIDLKMALSSFNTIKSREKHKKYIFTQRCLKKQVDFRIFKIKCKNKN